MNENMSKLAEIVKHIQKQQYILTKMLIHLGCRADLYDGFIQNCFNELKNLDTPKTEDHK